MAQRTENRSIDEAVELLKMNGFEALADAVTADASIIDPPSPNGL